MAITTTSTLPSPVQQTFNMKLLAVRVPTLIHDICAKFYRMPRNGGTTMRFRRYENLDTFPTPLGNSGENPPAQSPTAVDIDAKLSLYATYVVLNEQVVLQNNDPKKCGVFKFSLIDLESYGAIALW